MRKNKMMRLASALLVAVLLTTCAISGTFAKYVTAGSTNDTARVAKWGVTITGETGATNQLFAQEYATDDGVYTGAVSVAASENVVAPGTTGTLSKFDIAGTPEVAVRVTYTADLVLSGWKLLDDSTYCPVKFTVNGNVYQIAAGTPLADLEAAVEAAIVSATKDYAPGTDLSVVENDLTVSWEWPFESGNDSADTYLGNQAAIGSASTITLNITCTITQID